VQLEKLSLSANNFSNGLNPNIGKLLGLKELVLVGCELTTLPDEIGDLQQVSALQWVCFVQEMFLRGLLNFFVQSLFIYLCRMKCKTSVAGSLMAPLHVFEPLIKYLFN